MPTPPDPEPPPHTGPVLEPVRVVRLRRFDALAELMREMHPDPADPAAYESAGTPAGPRRAPPRTPESAEEETRELPPLPGGGARAARATGAPGPGPRRAGVAVAVAAAALVGFAGALLLPGRQEAAATAPPAEPAATASPTAPAPAAPTAPAATATAATPTPADDPDGPGTLREGDTGPEVADLQQRLLHVPDVYRDGSASGTYDATLTEAVARFQLWYGVSGDETGVYGDDTRRVLESRTGYGEES
ncbi:hypothetical protein GCM10010503_56070 [Streptomyces lucensis JCM 4490]|uniref:Peptidoglycan binding-like domain-containing protein n=1 Tax=Streptomyces lucensis JCM 4490 TaxID=1306176 RepID=A0A918JBQ8_9ACTN|nr:peptidoglycan-binding protein [Streptomyces lucensis]GGW71423.1 hypothetical protein GCM10010503_56070 [Streptomyces lucensis JCM 4490]